MLKVGALSFINSLPFFYPIFASKIPCEASFQIGVPTEINELLETGQIDIGLISSASFVANREKYVLLSNLGIGATRQVGSVCLYQKRQLQSLDGKLIAIPPSSATSVQLLRVLCSRFWKVTPHFIEYPKGVSLYELFDTVDAMLMIGDECLSTKIPANYKVIDLASAWYECTRKPFVFAVFATRCESWMDLPEEVRAFHCALSSAYEYSKKHFDDVIAVARAQVGLSSRSLRNYYNLLDYDLHSDHFQGLEQFAQLSKSELKYVNV